MLRSQINFGFQRFKRSASTIADANAMRELSSPLTFLRRSPLGNNVGEQTRKRFNFVNECEMKRFLYRLLQPNCHSGSSSAVP